MKVFVAGATGALGTQLVPMLVALGHDVVGMTRTAAKRDQLRNLGAEPVVADALEALLADDVALHGDGGGKARAIAHPLFGRRRVARTVLSYVQMLRRIEGFTIRAIELNGQPGALGLDGQQRVLAVM
jgi:uncharacterized protein YbjT (DUF2867 family)